MKSKFLAILAILLVFTGSIYAQDVPATITNRQTLAAWVRTGSFTFTNKTLSAMVFSGTNTGVFNLGSSGTPQAITTTPTLTVYNTSASTTGTVRSTIINQVHTGDGAAILEALRVNISSAVQTGSWANAVVARIAYSGATGDAGGGLAAALCSEIVLPAISSPAGSYFAADFEFEAPTSYVANTGDGFNVAFLRFGVYGTTVASFEDEAYFMHISTDFTDASGNMWYDNTLRIQIETTDWFIPLSDAEGEFSTAYLIDVSNATDASNLTTASIATDGGLAVTKQLFLGDDLDMSVSGTGVYDITLKTNMADALSITDGTDIMVFATTTGSPSIAITPATTITGLLTANGSIAVGDADYIGVTGNEIITFNTAGTIVASGISAFHVGGTAADDVTPDLLIVGDADSDGSATTSETLTISLTGNTTPTSATWGFASTQSAGYTFDKAVTITGGLGLSTATTGAAFSGTMTDGITFAGTVNDEVIDIGGTYDHGIRFSAAPVAADVTNSFINIGDYTTALAVAPTSANVFGVIQNVTLTDIDVAYWYQAYYTKITTSGTTTATSIAGHAYRINVASALEAVYGIQCHTNITAGADVTQEVISVSTMVDMGTGDTTTDRVVALQAMVTGSGTAGTVTGLLHVASFVNGGTVIDTDAIIFVSNQSAATADVAIEFDLDGTVTNCFEFNGTGPDAWTTATAGAVLGAFAEYVLIPVTVEGTTNPLFLMAAQTWQ